MNWEQNVRRVEPYVPGEQPKDKNVIKLNTNECPYPPAPGVRRAMEQMEAESFRLYPDTEATDLRAALSDFYNLKKEQIFVGVGSDDVLALIFLTFFNSDKPVVFPDVTYSFYDVWANLYRIPFYQIPLDDEFRIRTEDYICDNGGVVIANPNAPTAIAMPCDEIEKIIQNNKDVIVVVDEAYVDFGAESCIPLIEKYDNLLVVQTFSKSRSMAGMRIGYAMGQEKLIQYLNDAKFAINSYTLNTPTLEMGAESVKDVEYFNATVDKIIHTRERVKKELTALGFSYTDSKTNFLFATHETIPAVDIYNYLKGENIYVRYWNKARINNHLRITIGTDEEMDVLIAKLKKYINK